MSMSTRHDREHVPDGPEDDKWPNFKQSTTKIALRAPAAAVVGRAVTAITS